jgi:hypothetical protein
MLREVADTPAALCRLTQQQRGDLRHVADLLCRLDKLKGGIEAGNPEDDDQSDRLAMELVTLLGLTRS